MGVDAKGISRVKDRVLSSLLCLVLIFLLESLSGAIPSVVAQLTDLGIPSVSEGFPASGIRSAAERVNNHGLILGVMSYSDSSPTSFESPFFARRYVIWEKDASLPPPGYKAIPIAANYGCIIENHDHCLSSPVAINDAGHIVGSSYRFPGDRNFFAMLWKRDSNGNYTITNLAQLGDNVALYNSEAYGINAGGDIVGTLPDLNCPVQATLWKNLGSTIVNLGQLIPGANQAHMCSEARSINTAGQIVGWVWPNSREGGSTRAVLWNSETSAPINLPLPANTPDGTDSGVFHINDVGQILGRVGSQNVIWENPAAGGNYQSPLILPDLSSSIVTGPFTTTTGINAAGQIVGSSITDTGAARAVRWQKFFDLTIFPLGYKYVITDLGTLGGKGSGANGINDAGVIVGAASTVDEKHHAFVSGACAVSKTVVPVAKDVSINGWTFSYFVSDKDGLVVENIRLAGRVMANKFSLPYYNLLDDQQTELPSVFRLPSGGFHATRFFSY